MIWATELDLQPLPQETRRTGQTCQMECRRGQHAEFAVPDGTCDRLLNRSAGDHIRHPILFEGSIYHYSGCRDRWRWRHSDLRSWPGRTATGAFSQGFIIRWWLLHCSPSSGGSITGICWDTSFDPGKSIEGTGKSKLRLRMIPISGITFYPVPVPATQTDIHSSGLLG